MFGWFKKKPAKAAELEWEEYRGFRIAATPIPEGSQYRVSGRIEKDDADQTRSHTFVRADLVGDLDEAKGFCLMKAKLMVDQLGDSLFTEG
ncbi:HlyU family transcriptional regulator [Reinekea sp. G2M2-21]|uniref:HlyU family transcriptional regulator n=1 Tax=Reinekea sp. G2M2-21 TaxID=2788942 RepID=UPI0018A99599|nr:HlyU family transcriptional regulator [Reinekea sp. G2M2-21]